MVTLAVRRAKEVGSHMSIDPRKWYEGNEMGLGGAYNLVPAGYDTRSGITGIHDLPAAVRESVEPSEKRRRAYITGLEHLYDPNLSALLIPLIAAGVWAAFLLTTKGSTDPNLKLSPPTINNTLIFLLVFAAIYTIFLMTFIYHKKHQKRMIEKMIKASKQKRVKRR